MEGFPFMTDFGKPTSTTPNTESLCYNILPAGAYVKTEESDDDSSSMNYTHFTTYKAWPEETIFTQPIQTDPDMEEVNKEITCVCEHLNIPSDPYMWSVDQVHKWVLWTLNKYQLPTYYLEQFTMDGTSLCMLSEQDFNYRSPHVGEYLFAELEFLKSALTVSSPDPPGQHKSNNTTYTDLDTCSNHSQTFSVASSMAEASLPLNIPKPIFSEPLSLSPAPSLESVESNTSGYGSSPSSYISEAESRDKCYGMSHSDIGGGLSPSKQNIHLWQFLRELLLHPQSYSNCIRWLDRSQGIFKIEDSARVARLWGQRKKRPAMNYDKLSRSIRQYYKKGIIGKTENSKRLVYQFRPQYRV